MLATQAGFVTKLRMQRSVVFSTIITDDNYLETFR